MAENVKVPDTPEKNRRESESSDSEREIHFTPIVTLPEVKVVTYEEDEEEILILRARIYRFDRKSDPPEWKERGTGNLKILRHKEKNSFRIVMRRDKTLKVCANHFITPWMELMPHSDNNKTFTYTVPADFADETAKSECLAVRFVDREKAELFKKTVEDVKKRLMVECDLYNGKVDEEIRKEIEQVLNNPETDEEEEIEKELTEKISKLDVQKEGSDEDSKEKDEWVIVN